MSDDWLHELISDATVKVIRARNEKRKMHDTEDRDEAYMTGKRDDDFDREAREFYDSACADIDHLLEVIERLRQSNPGAK